MHPVELATTHNAASDRATRPIRRRADRQAGTRITLVDTDRDTGTKVMLPLEPNHPYYPPKHSADSPVRLAGTALEANIPGK